MTNPRVVIIGCGPAGFSAACKLLENNYTNITILEAENRIGGRINTVPFADGVVDLGAQWCHGQEGNIVYNMVKDINLVETSKCNYENFMFIDSQSIYANKNETDKLIELLNDISEDEKVSTYNGSFGDYMIKKYEEKLKTQYPEIGRALANQVLDWYHKLQNTLNASPNWFDVSVKNDYIECEGDQTLTWKDKGYKTILSVLKKEIPDPSKKLPIDDKILLKKEVIKINWDDSNKKNKEIVVECTDGTKYKADHVIVTVSLGVLKHIHKSLFVPELPLFKKNAIQGLSFGNVGKILLKFSENWWKDNCAFNILWRQEDKKKVLTEFTEGPVIDGESWLTTFYAFHPLDNNPKVLLAFVTGDVCKEVESLSDELVMRGCMYVLKKFAGKHFKNIPNPECVLRSSWVSNKHFRGSYSYHSLETDRLNTCPEDLAKPLGNNVLLFAGEATNPNHYSTVHGAVESGFREAERIISHYK